MSNYLQAATMREKKCGFLLPLTIFPLILRRRRPEPKGLHADVVVKKGVK
jgi:hypothetical protein